MSRRNQLTGVYAVTVGPDISDEPIRFLFASEIDAHEWRKENDPEGVITYEPIAHSLDDQTLLEYTRALEGDLA